MTEQRSTYSSMETSTVEDWAIFTARQPARRALLPGRLNDMLKQLKSIDDGAPINPFAHSLQSATLAYEDDADDETVFMALFHDIGQFVSEDNHSQVSAAILKPYLSEQGYWIIKHHGIFQGYYYFHHVNQDRHARDTYSDNPHYEACVEWCDKYDQRAFRSDYPSKPLEFFGPMIERVMLPDGGG